MRSILSLNKLRLLQRGGALLLLIAGMSCIGVWLGIFDISIVMYAKCRTCLRTEIPSAWTIRLLGLMFTCFSIAMFCESFGKKGILTSFIGASGWLIFCGLLMRQAIYSNDEPVTRAIFGAMSVLFFLCFLFGYLWWAFYRRKSAFDVSVGHTQEPRID